MQPGVAKVGQFGRAGFNWWHKFHYLKKKKKKKKKFGSIQPLRGRTFSTNDKDLYKATQAVLPRKLVRHEISNCIFIKQDFYVISEKQVCAIQTRAIFLKV